MNHSALQMPCALTTLWYPCLLIILYPEVLPSPLKAHKPVTFRLTFRTPLYKSMSEQFLLKMYAWSTWYWNCHLVTTMIGGGVSLPASVLLLWEGFVDVCLIQSNGVSLQGKGIFAQCESRWSKWGKLAGDLWSRFHYTAPLTKIS